MTTTPKLEKRFRAGSTEIAQLLQQKKKPMRIVTKKKKSLIHRLHVVSKKRWWSFDSDQTVEKAPFHSLPSDSQQQNYLFCCFQSSCYPVLSLSLSIEICSCTIDQCLSSDGSVWAEVDIHPVLVLLLSSILSSSTSSIEQPVAASFDALAIAQLMTPHYEL